GLDELRPGLPSSVVSGAIPSLEDAGRRDTISRGQGVAELFAGRRHSPFHLRQLRLAQARRLARLLLEKAGVEPKIVQPLLVLADQGEVRWPQAQGSSQANEQGGGWGASAVQPAVHGVGGDIQVGGD